MSDDVFEVDDEISEVTRLDYLNGTRGSLAPVRNGEQYYSTTPSPTGYRDYKPPIEVLNDSYRTISQGSENSLVTRDSVKRTNPKDEGIAHKVRYNRIMRQNLVSQSILYRKRLLLYFELVFPPGLTNTNPQAEMFHHAGDFEMFLFQPSLLARSLENTYS